MSGRLNITIRSEIAHYEACEKFDKKINEALKKIKDFAQDYVYHSLDSMIRKETGISIDDSKPLKIMTELGFIQQSTKVYWDGVMNQVAKEEGISSHLIRREFYASDYQYLVQALPLPVMKMSEHRIAFSKALYNLMKAYKTLRDDKKSFERSLKLKLSAFNTSKQLFDNLPELEEIHGHRFPKKIKNQLISMELTNDIRSMLAK